jgi:hypothetical protein
MQNTAILAPLSNRSLEKSPIGLYQGIYEETETNFQI